MVFEEREEPEYPGKNLSLQSREPVTQPTLYDMTPSLGIGAESLWWEASETSEINNEQRFSDSIASIRGKILST